MTPTTDRTGKAVSLFNAGCSCSQAVFVAYSDAFGVDEHTAMKLSCGLGGGVGRMREVCGAVSAMALLAGLKFGNGTPQDVDAKKKTYEIVQQMAGAFREKNGSIICRDLLGLERPECSPTPGERTAAYYKGRPCMGYVADASALIERFLVCQAE